MSIAARRLMRVQRGTLEPPYTGPITLAMSGIWGAGFQNAGDKAKASIHPTIAGGLVTGADVAGVHISEDYGDDWHMTNENLIPDYGTRVATVRWSETTANRLYLFVCAYTSASGRLYVGDYVSSTKSIKWNKLADVGAGAMADSANGAPGEGGIKHPRQTGKKLMLLDESNGYIYIGTINGIYRYTITTKAIIQWQLTDKWITSLSFDPNTHATMFVTADGMGSNSGIDGPAGTGGAWQITNALTSPTITESHNIVGTFPQACTTVKVGSNTHLYVATGADKIVRWNGNKPFSDATGWSNVTNNLNADSESLTSVRWSGIDATVESGNATLLVTDSCNSNGRSGGTVAWSFNGGNSWTKTFTMNKNINGVAANGEWWFARNEYSNDSLLIGGPIFDSVNPIIDPDDPSRWYIMGRSGAWRTKNRGSSWHPIVKGMGVTMGHSISCLENQPDMVMAGDTDWTSFFSEDGLATQPKLCRKLGEVCWVISAKEFPNGVSTDNTVVLSLGSRDGDPGSKGNIVVHRNPWGNPSGAWMHQIADGKLLPGVTSVDSTPRCLGSSVAQVGSNEIVLGVFQGKGLFRKQGLYISSTNQGGSWDAVAGMSGVGTSKFRLASFAWSKNNQNIVWMCDVGSNTIARSINAGITWDSFAHSGGLSQFSTIRADRAHVGVYYFVGNGSIWRITNGDDPLPTLTQINAPTSNNSPGCIAVHPTSGRVAITSLDSGGKEPCIWTIDYGSSTYVKRNVPGWNNVGYVEPHSIAWDIGDKLYVSLYAGYVVVQGLNTA